MRRPGPWLPILRWDGGRCGVEEKRGTRLGKGVVERSRYDDGGDFLKKVVLYREVSFYTFRSRKDQRYVASQGEGSWPATTDCADRSLGKVRRM